MDAFIEWKLKRYARLKDVSPEILAQLESRIDTIIGNPLGSQDEAYPKLVDINHAPPPEEGEDDGHDHAHEVFNTQEQLRFDSDGATVENIDGGDKVRVTSPFGPRIHPVTNVKSFHDGVDLGVPQGSKLYSIAEGTVVSRGSNSTSGKFIEVEHSDGRRVSYAHLSRWIANKGDVVSTMQVIALSGRTGRITGPHLHLIVKVPKRDAEGKIVTDNRGRTKWVSRAPTVEEMRLALGGRDLSNVQEIVTPLTSSIIFDNMSFVKTAVSVSIEPYYSIIQDAVVALEAKQPGYFNNVSKIIVEPGAPDHFGKVESDKPEVIFLSLDKIRSILSSGDPEATKMAIIETISHEMGHLKSKFQGGESPAEAESKRVMEVFNAK